MLLLLALLLCLEVSILVRLFHRVRQEGDGWARFRGIGTLPPPHQTPVIDSAAVVRTLRDAA